MSIAAAAAAGTRSRLPFAVLAAGFAGGLVDFVYASVAFGVMRGKSVEKVWQGVAGGWIGGKAAGQSGLSGAALGVATHFGIAITMAAVFAVVALRVKALYQRPLISGVLYGLLLYAVMYRVVLPLRFPAVFPKWDGVQSLCDIASHVGVGLAIAWVLSRSARRAFEH